MKFIKLIKFISLTIAMSFFVVSCEVDSKSENHLDSTHVGLVKNGYTINLLDGETVTYEGKVFAAKAVNYDRIIDLEVVYTSTYNTLSVPPTTVVQVTTANPNYFTVPTSVTIPAGEVEGTFPVSITGTDLASGREIVISLVPKEDMDVSVWKVYSDLSQPNYEILYDRLILKLKPICDLNPLRIIIATDAYGSETSWELYDADLSIIAQGGPFADQSAAGVYVQDTQDICLPNGNYTFVVYDSYGDGMNSGAGEGYYRLVLMNADGSAEVSEIAKNGVFGANDIVEFSFP